ncbi:MAG: cell envelope integrity protein TolA [Candidatus Zixiibacteriota bacterium]|nr:MAG: cell envelope integrity protein TolA [candidate division Zixibacteria bacterium]
MIELTPREVEACRRLKAFTEKQLSEELYEAIQENDNFMGFLGEMCLTALQQLRQVTESLKKNANATEKDIEKVLEEAGKLQLWYKIGKDEKAKGPGELKKERDSIDQKRQEKIDTYRKKITELMKDREKANKKFNDDLYEHKKDKKKQAEIRAKYFVERKKIDGDLVEQWHKIDWQDAYADSLKRKAMPDYADDFKLKDIDKLQKWFTAEKDKPRKFSPSDGSDVFRLFGTVIEELPKLLKEKNKDFSVFGDKASDLELWVGLRQSYRETTGLEWSDLMDEDLKPPEELPQKYQVDQSERLVKYCPKCQKHFEEKNDAHIYVEVRHEYICQRCRNTRRKTYKGKLSDYKDERQVCKKGLFKKCKAVMVLSKKQVKYVCHRHKSTPLEDRIRQDVICTNDKCGKKGPKVMYFALSDRILEKPGRCPDCKEKKTLEPAVATNRPFWGGQRSRRRDNWLQGAILHANSVVRLIDRLFGHPEGADISGTTADTLFGIELTANLTHYGDKVVGTQRSGVELGGARDEKEKAWIERTKGYSGLLALLPLITMSKHGHHTILECALTMTLTGYLNSYHLGYYTTLLPKGTVNAGKIGEILKKWENSPSNVRLVIDRDSEEFVAKGWLFSADEVNSRKDESFYDMAKINYQRYVDVFEPLRSQQKGDEKEIGYHELWMKVCDSNIAALDRNIAALDKEI